MDKSTTVINELLVDLFNDILQIEEKSLKNAPISDLSITEIHTLTAIGMHEQKTMSEIAQSLNITVGTLTTAINRLIKKGYVERKRIEEDRRVVLVNTTKKGKLALRLHDRFHYEMVHTAIEGLNPDEETVLIRSLEKLGKFFEDKYEL